MNIGENVLYKGQTVEVTEVNGEELTLAIPNEGAETSTVVVNISEVEEIAVTDGVAEEPKAEVVAEA